MSEQNVMVMNAPELDGKVSPGTAASIMLDILLGSFAAGIMLLCPGLTVELIAALNEYGLSRDAVDSKETELLPVPDDVKALPDIRGWGNVHSLQQAIVRNASG